MSSAGSPSAWSPRRIRVGRTIDDLLELSRIEIDETLEHEVVHVGDVVAEAVAAHPSGAPSSTRIALAAHDVDRDVTVIGDRRQLVSALFNLLDNAVKYSEPGAGRRGQRRDDRRLGRDRRTRPRHRHPAPRHRPDLRALLPGGPRPQPRDRRHRSRARRSSATSPSTTTATSRVESREGEGSTFTLTLPRHLASERHRRGTSSPHLP